VAEEKSLEAVLRTVRSGRLGAELRRGANPGANPTKPAAGAETPQAVPRKLRTSSLARARARGGPAAQCPARTRADRAAMREVCADPTTRAVLREAVIEGTAESLAQHHREVLERLGPAKKVVDRLAQLLLDVLALPEDGTEALQRRQAALEVLQTCKRDSLAGLIRAYARLLESIQSQTLKAFGADKQTTPAKPSPPQSPPPAATNTEVEVLLSRLSSERLAALIALAEELCPG
jgi:hypothetical protein